MKKNKVPKATRGQRSAPLFSMRVRLVSKEQAMLVASAAKRRGMGRDEFIQEVLQAASERVLGIPRPPEPSLSEISGSVIAEI